uniref:Uncharacterized protein n=1 Tax=Timema douglasi TaxID=61478 RepID=A0A7R8VS58_TIMDO|nr:unnamed protein product [Timema douglasi]
MRWDPNKPQPTIQDFDKKLVEADAYLQIIIDQVKALELRMEGLSNHDDKMRCQSIVNHANDMLDAIKHTIVLLQIAKGGKRFRKTTLARLDRDSNSDPFIIRRPVQHESDA